jgi:hypothetical protein
MGNATNRDSGLSVRDHTLVEPVRSTPDIWRFLLSYYPTRYVPKSIVDYYNNVVGKKTPIAEKLGLESDAWITDVTTGIGHFGFTAAHVRNTVTKIGLMYREALALEFDKDKDSVNFLDFVKSKNHFVKDALYRLFLYNGLRVLAGIPFFTRIGAALLDKHPEISDKLDGHDLDPAHLKKFNATDMGIGVSAILLILENSRKETFYEALNEVTSSEYNNDKNIVVYGDENNLGNLYQEFAEKFAKKKKVRGYLNGEGVRRENLEKICARISELFYDSYQNQSPTSEKGRFELPHYLHLLGSNKIDPDKLEKTLLYIEVLHDHGSKAVKELDKHFKKLKNPTPKSEARLIEELAEGYGIKLDVALGAWERKHGKSRLENTVNNGMPSPQQLPPAMVNARVNGVPNGFDSPEIKAQIDAQIEALQRVQQQAAGVPAVRINDDVRATDVANARLVRNMEPSAKMTGAANN